MDRRTKTILYVYGFLLVIGGLTLAFIQYGELKDQQESIARLKTPCQIIEWGVSVTHSPFESRLIPEIVYEYSINGTKHCSSFYDKDLPSLKSLRDFEEEGVMARRGPTFCYVDPATPEKASYHPASLKTTYLWMSGGVLLALLGLASIIAAKTWAKPPHIVDLYPLAGLCLFGCIALYMFSKRVHMAVELRTPAVFWNWDVSSQLTQVPARVDATWIGVREHKRTTYYSPRVLYSYQQDGQQMQADQWLYDNPNFDLKDENLANKHLTDAGYIPGREIICWVHPQKPWIATLKPKLDYSQFWKLVLFAILTLFCGVLFKRSKK